MTHINWTREITEGDEVREVHHQLPAVWEICGGCDGEGKSSAHLGCFTASEFEEAFDSPNDQDAYFNGAYDRQCTTCGGSGKIKIIDRDRMNPEILEEYDREQKAIAEVEAESASERRYFAMCSGDWG